MTNTNRKTGSLAKKTLALALSLAMLATLLTGFAGAANYHDKDSKGGDSGKYYLLTGRDNFEAGLDLGLLATKLEIPNGTNAGNQFGDLTPAFGGKATITYDELYRLVGSPELDYALISAPSTITLSGVSWADIQAWLFYIGAPISATSSTVSDLDADGNGTLSIAEQLSLAANPYKQALGFVSVSVGDSAKPVLSGGDYSTNLEYPDTAGYNTNTSGSIKGKILDYMLTDANNVIIPARFNIARDDILITSRTKLTSYYAPGYTTGIVGNPLFTPNIALTVADDGGIIGDDDSSPEVYVNSKTALHMVPAWTTFGNPTSAWQLIIRPAAQAWNNSTAANIATVNVPGAQYDHVGANSAAENFNKFLPSLQAFAPTGISSNLFGFGAQVVLNGFYRQGLGATPTTFGDADSTWTATDADRAANAVETITVESNIKNSANADSLATPNTQKLSIEITRPWIESGDVFTLTFNPAEQSFDSLLGLGSITLHDDGVLPAAGTDGKPQYVGVNDANATLGVRKAGDTAWTLYNLKTQAADIAAKLADILADAGSDVDVELVYLYAAADTTGIVGKFPDDITKNEGAYAAPLLRTVTLTDTPVPGEHLAYVAGYPDGTVRPGASITRAEVCQVIYNIILPADVKAANTTKTSPFPDVPETDWYATAVATCYKAGLLSGYPDGTFKPSNPISRAEIASIFRGVIALRGAEDLPANAGTKYADVDEIEGFWAAPAIYSVTRVGWMFGRGAGYFGIGEMTRAEFMTMVNHILWREPELLTDLLDGMKTWPDNADTSAWYYREVQEATNSHEYVRKTSKHPTRAYYFEKWTKLL
ncbi:MAG: S-layer homology domain-containing protein [Oscillospiraceae bacterium]|jgi:hypothetical protein|nr:S-layer homology domain-containing protein [Oscillospiraceae bacterium]